MFSPISRMHRSWLLIKASWNVLRSDGELIVLPAISGVAALIVAATFIALAFAGGVFDDLQAGAGADAFPPSFYAGLFAFYVVQYFIIFFFNTALVDAALERLDGGDPTLLSALALAGSRAGAILGYAVISATVGVLLRALAERLGFIGRLVEAGVGLAWTVSTFLVVPVLAAERVGPVEAITKSAALLRKSWGENLIGNAGISLALSAVTFVVALVGFGGGWLLVDGGYRVLAVPLFFAAIFTLLIAVLLGTALSAVYAATVYRYAVTGAVPPGFDADLIEGAFEFKGR